MFQIDYQNLEIILLKYINSICLFEGGVLLNKFTSPRREEWINKRGEGERGQKLPKMGWRQLRMVAFKNCTSNRFRLLYAKLVRLNISFKHILVEKLTHFFSVSMYILTSPSIKIAITHENHLLKNVSLLFL